MKKECDENERKYTRKGVPIHRSNSLLENLLEKQEEIVIYKERLKELESAFYYNLDIIQERDLEISILEKQINDGNEALQRVIQERDELDDIVKIFDDKNCKRIQQLETELALKTEEVKKLQRNDARNEENLKRNIESLKQNQQRKLIQLTAKLDSEKNELLKSYREEVEEKEKNYLLEIDHLAGKLEEAYIEKNMIQKIEEENNYLKCSLEDTKKLLKEKEKHYKEEIKKLNKSHGRIAREIQCSLRSEGVDKMVQTETQVKNNECQTTNVYEPDEEYIKKLNHLQQQNDVLKMVIKDLKKNRDLQSDARDNPENSKPCAECNSVRAEVHEVNKKFETEISNLKKILSDEQMQRAEEEAIIQSLETSVVGLKDRLLNGLQQKLEDYQGDDLCGYTYNKEIQNEIKLTLLEQELSKRINSLISSAEEERQKINEKLEELKKECLEKIRNLEKPSTTELESENLLEKIRLEIQKLENKIEGDMKNVVRNNNEIEKCDKNFQTRLDFSDSQVFKGVGANQNFRKVSSGLSLPKVCFRDEIQAISVTNLPKTYLKNDITREKCISLLKTGREPKFHNHLQRKIVSGTKN